MMRMGTNEQATTRGNQQRANASRRRRRGRGATSYKRDDTHRLEVTNSKETGENGRRDGTFARVMSGLVRCEKESVGSRKKQKKSGKGSFVGGGRRRRRRRPAVDLSQPEFEPSARDAVAAQTPGVTRKVASARQ